MYYCSHCYYCLLVPADLTLTTDTLTELFQSVEDRDPQDPDSEDSDTSFILDFLSYDIGGLLCLPESTLAEIRKRYQSKAKRKEAYHIHDYNYPAIYILVLA